MMDGEAIEHEMRLALAGNEPALTRFVEVLTPVIQSRVARGLLLRRTGTAAGRDIRQEVEDLTQEIFLVLFDDGGKVLRSWQPERGLSLLTSPVSSRSGRPPRSCAAASGARGRKTPSCPRISTAR